MRFTVIGDVGVHDGMLHIGDEAMFEAALDAFRSRGIEVTALSAAPRETAGRYGVTAIERIGGWGANRARNLTRMAAVLGERRHLDDADPARTVIETVAGSDAVVIAGGGNLASTWPLHVFERATLGRLAAAAGVPLLVTGQTLGPALDADDRALVGAMLRAAAVVGVRERRSFELAATLGVPPARLRLGPDDASLLRSAADASLRPSAAAASLRPSAADASLRPSAAAASLLPSAAGTPSADATLRPPAADASLRPSAAGTPSADATLRPPAVDASLRPPADASLLPSAGAPANAPRSALFHKSGEVQPDAPTSPDLRKNGRELGGAPYCLVTVANHTGAFDRGAVRRGLAALLDDVVATTGLRVVFLGHFSPIAGGPRGDETVHEVVASLMAEPSERIRATDARTAADLARGAALVVTSRYHPAVFAAPAGVPVVAVPVDDYTDVKLRGVLEHGGQTGVLPAEALLQEGGAGLVARVWAERHRIREQAAARRPALHDEAEAWWDRLVDAAGGSTPAVPNPMSLH